MPYWIWSLLAIVLFVPVLIRVLTWLSIRGLRFQTGGTVLAAESDIPGWEKEVLDGAHGILTGLGFRPAGYAKYKDWAYGEPDTRSIAYYLHEELPIWAWALPSDSPLPQAPFAIGYASRFSDGTLLITRNMESDSGSENVPYLKLRILFSDSWEEVWKAHLNRHREMEPGTTAERIGLEAMLAVLDRSNADVMQGLRDKGELVPAEDSLEKLNLKGSWNMARTVNRLRGPLLKAYQAWMKRTETFPLPSRAEAQSYLRQMRFAPKADILGKILLVLISLIVYAFAWGSDASWTNALIFISVLFFHEMGHALMMRGVGYRDVNVFFIPFLGAVAMGKPRKAIAAWKEALVLLAGPVPGLVLGAWLVAAKLPWHSRLLYQTGMVALVINGLNLLPFTPFDGGRLMELIFFRRSPALGRIFMAMSGLALLTMSIYAHEPVLAALGVLIFATLRRIHRQAVVLAGMRRDTGTGRDWEAQGEGPDSPAYLEAIMELFTRLRPEKPMYFALKASQVKVMLRNLHLQVPGVPIAAGVFLLYLACWCVPAYMIGFHHVLPGTKRAKPLTRADLKPPELAMYDGLCTDSSVLDIRMYRRRDSLTLYLNAIAGDDTSRLRVESERWLEPPAAAVAGSPEAPGAYGGPWRKIRGGGRVQIRMLAPVWSFGDLDSALGRDLVYPYDDEDDEEEYDTLPPSDSALAARRDYEKKVDSLMIVEAGIWRSWPADRKKAWLEELRRKRAARGDTLHCWKKFDPARRPLSM
jgi:Zn-dependent protease